jgi:serine/threonine-protein kinase
MGYELIRMIDTGGMGVVYLARDHVTDRVVAMKFLRGGLVSGSAADRFLVEVRALAALDHPNIVRVLATDFYRPDPFFTMEYEAGGTLAAAVEARGPLPTAEAVVIIRAVTLAVATAHAGGVLHRDLKPSNILLAADGTPKVSDFGLAKRTDKDDGITGESVALGTPGYMPPEQISRRHGEVGPASDVYGLGATLYHLLTGRAPFKGETPADTMGRVVADLPERPRSLRPEIPLALEAVVMRCLEKRPADRYPTPAALAAALDAYLAGGDPDAPLLTPIRRLRRWAHRQRRKLAAGAGAMLLLAGVFALGAAIWPRSTPPEPPDPFEHYRAELAAGREVVFIPSEGKPRFHRWLLGGPELTTSQTGDGSCSYETNGISLLEFCPDPMTDRYLVRAKIRFVEHKLAGGPPQGAVSAGVYFARNTAAGNNGLIIHKLFAVTFNDLPRGPKEKPPADGSPERTVRFRGIYLRQQPDNNPTPGTVGNKWAEINMPPNLPGPWRTIEIEVTHERVTVRWQAPDGKMTLLANQSGDEIRSLWAELHGKLDKNVPNHGVEKSGWSPRAPIGIWNYRATIDVKDVSVTPLK